MKVCIIGGGKIGYYVAKTLLSHHHGVVMIELREAVCQRLARELDIPITCGNGTDPQVLERAGCRGCGVLVSVTGQDQVNLVTCQLAKRLYGVKKTVARVNNPENAAVLQLLGVDKVVSVTDTIARILEVEVETDAIRQLLQLSDGETSLREITLPADFAFSGRTLAQIPLPDELTIVSVTRAGQLIIARGQTCLMAGDTLLCLAREAGFAQLQKKWKLQ